MKAAAVVHTVVGTAANVHDSTVLGELLHGGEDAVIADAAYQSHESAQMARAAGLDWRVCERAARGQPLTSQQKKRHRAIAQVRAFGEHPYRIVKQLWGHTKVRYRGIAKNLGQLHMCFGLANLCQPVPDAASTGAVTPAIRPRHQTNGAAVVKMRHTIEKPKPNHRQTAPPRHQNGGSRKTSALITRNSMRSNFSELP